MIFVGDFGKGKFCRKAGSLDLDNEICTLCPVDGDYNGDSEVSVADAVLLARFVAEDDTLEKKVIQAITLETADFDKDGLLTVMDVRKLLRSLTSAA